jgi:hypothetical protein
MFIKINNLVYMKKVYRTHLSFSKAELYRAQMRLEQAGLAVLIPSKDEYKALQNQFGKVMGKSTFNFDMNEAEMETLRNKKKVLADVTPTDEDYVKVPFRLLSATIIGAFGWKATDFSDEAVLRKSMELLNNKPVYTDHDTYTVNNVVGKVFTVGWQSAYTGTDGKKVPAGINGLVGVDFQTNPKLARDVISGAVHSNSVTIAFDWIPSHDFGDGTDAEYDFLRNVGKVIDGKMVCRKVVDIHDYFETSLVWLGSDPFAKKIDDQGNLLNVDKSAVFENETEQVKKLYSKENYYKVLNFDSEKLILPTKDAQKFFKSLTSSNMNEDVVKALVIKFGLTNAEELTLEQVERLSIKTEDNADAQVFEEYKKFVGEITTGLQMQLSEVSKNCKLVTIEDFSRMSNDAVQLGTVSKELTEVREALALANDKIVSVEKANGEMTNEVAKLHSTNGELSEKLTTQESLAKVGEGYISARREEAVRLYKVAAGNLYDEIVVGLFNKATSEELDGLLKQYVQSATSKFTARCKKCGSDEFAFRSSLVIEDINKDDEHTSDDDSFEGMYEKYSSPTMDLKGKKN